MKSGLKIIIIKNISMGTLPEIGSFGMFWITEIKAETQISIE